MSFANELKMVHITRIKNSVIDAQNKRIEELEKIVKGYIFAHALISKATD